MSKVKKILALSRVQTDFLLFLLTLFLLLVWTKPLTASPGKPPRNAPKLVPASLLNWPLGRSDYAVIVDKSVQKIYVYHWKNLFKPVKVYACSTGENNGPKTRRNDKKTPEGIYFFTHAYVKRDLAPIYGVRAFPIDYPNPMDERRGKDGYGIWFHGTNKPLKPFDTNGCIVLEDRDIDELAAYIQLNNTPVIISAKVEMVSPDQLETEKRQLLGVIERWKDAWEGEEIDQYMSLYSPGFNSDGKDWEQWKQYKALLANKYTSISVEIDNLQLLRNSGTVLAKFDQHYSTEGLESKGEKRLYLQQNSSEWKIVGEFFQKEKVTRRPPRKPYVSALDDIKTFITSWKKAWEEKDLETYIGCYDNGFLSRGMDLKAWEQHRERLNQKYLSIRVDLTDLSIVQVSNSKAKVSFKQDYQADGYHDFGLKNLLLIKRGENWKIQKETWQKLSGKSRL